MPSLTELRTQVEEKDQQVQSQLDRIYQMVQEGKPAQFVQVEFKHAVERMAEKYSVLLAMVDAQKQELGDADHASRADALRDQCKEDIIALAVAIDEALGINQ